MKGRKNILDIRVIFEDGSQAYIEMHILELQKLREFGTIKPRKLDFWMWFIDYTSREMIELAERSVEEIREAVKKLRELEADPIVSEIAFKEQLEEMDYNAEISSAKQEGIEQGKVEIAKKMKLKGIEISVIMEVTGLSEEEIEEL